ncbi:hypothetical protein JCM19297_5 [Nonlabens ulvanivorans]|nr:hypothetical protein JCM19297_5 [Nonlabens ulvanivorans]
MDYAIYNLSGQLVQRGVYHNNDIQIKDLNTGLYLVQIKSAGELLNTVKLVKQ